MIIRATVGEGAVLRWLPEQLVPVRGCRHVLRCDVQLAPTASVLWREEVILGRTGEPRAPWMPSFAWCARACRSCTNSSSSMAAIRRCNGAPSLLGGARAVGSLLVAGPDVPEHLVREADDVLRGAVLELEAGGRLATATATSAARLRTWLDARLTGLAPPQARAAAEAAPPHPDPQEILSR